MSFRELSMIDVKEVLRRWQAGQSARQMAREGVVGRRTAARYLDAAKELVVSLMPCPSHAAHRTSTYPVNGYSLITDNGKALTATEIEEGLTPLGIVHWTTLPYHHRIRPTAPAPALSGTGLTELIPYQASMAPSDVVQIAQPSKS
jgi:hypothetical protein